MSFIVQVDAENCDPRAVDPAVYGKFKWNRGVADRTKACFAFEHDYAIRLFMANHAHLNPVYMGEFPDIVLTTPDVQADFSFPWSR